MAYTATYDSNDLSPVVIDGLTAILVVGAQLATLIGIVILYAWMKKRGFKLN